MSLSEQGYAERKWGPYPEIRKAYEDLPVDWWDGGNSNTYRFIEGLTDFVEITKAITKDATRLEALDRDGVSRDVAMLRQRLAYYVDVMQQVDDRLAAIG